MRMYKSSPRSDLAAWTRLHDVNVFKNIQFWVCRHESIHSADSKTSTLESSLKKMVSCGRKSDLLFQNQPDSCGWDLSFLNCCFSKVAEILSLKDKHFLSFCLKLQRSGCFSEKLRNEKAFNILSQIHDLIYREDKKKTESTALILQDE